MRALSIGISSFVAFLSCGGALDPTPCETSIAPVVVPLAVPFQANYATLVATPSVEINRGLVHHFDIFLTEFADGCPSFSKYRIGEESATHDTPFLEVWLSVPDYDGVVATFPIEQTIYPDKDGSGTVAMGTLMQGALISSGTWVYHSAVSGTITVTEFVDGDHLAGAIDTTLEDGTPFSAAFDGHFCTSSCGGR